MDLVERYLAAIAGQLPRKQREDVVAELRDDLLSRVEERESALGRPLRQEETEALLREFGHPLVVAGRYWPIQQLIGPETFPFYIFFLKAILLLVLAVHLIAAVVGAAIASEPVRAFANWPGGLISSMAMSFAWVTAFFVVVEHFGIQRRLAGKWRASNLPIPKAKPRKHPSELVFEAASGVIFILWWTGQIHFRDFVPGMNQPGLRIEMSDVWTAFYWPILIYACAQLAMNVIDFLRPAWVTFSAVANATIHLACAALAILLIKAGPLATVTGAAAPQVAEPIQLGLTISFAIVAAISVAQALGDALRLARVSRPQWRWASC